MKLSYLLIFIFFASSLHFSQTVSTIINTGSGINDDIILLEDGSIIGSDHSGTNVYLLLPDGTMDAIASGINAPNGLEKDALGNILIGAPKENKIYKLSNDGTLTVYAENIVNPNNLIFKNGTDTLLTASYLNSQIYEVAPDGSSRLIFEGAPLNGPLGMNYDSDGYLYIANFTDGKIFKVINGNLDFFAQIPAADIGGLLAAIGFLKYINGYFYATGFGTNKIYRIDMSGNVETFAGSGIAGTMDGGASGARFYWPNGITSNLAGDTLYISEYNSHAVRMITDFVTSVEVTNIEKLPNEFRLDQNYPNPFNPSTKINFNLLSDERVKLSIYNLLGEEVSVLVNSFLNKGYHSVKFLASEFPSGVYIYRLSTTSGYSAARKMTLQK